MNNPFLIDLWSDLRAKRMWPVALVLLLALVAVPVVLSKPSEEPAVAPAPTPTKTDQTAQVKGLAALKVADDTPGKGSTLDVFDPSNPFKPPENILKNSATDSGTATSDTGATTDTGATGATDTGSTGGTTGGTTGGSDTGGGSTPSGGETKTVEYRYVADVTFTGANGKKRKIKSLERLAILPNERDPLLIFLGASKNGGNAVFLVDSTLTAEGEDEGKCKPSKAQCGFLYLGPGSEEEFVDQNGGSYTLRVDAIRKVKVTPEKASKATTSKSSSNKRTADAAVGDDTAVRRFVPQLIGDLVTQSTVQSKSSDGDQTGR
jgi:hypothetical protein